MKMDQNYDKIIKKTEILGAKIFKKFVYKVEEIKFNLLRGKLSFLNPMVEKRLYKQKEKLKNKTKDDELKKIIELKYKESLILYRKELVTGMNRNYHINTDSSTDFIQYLEFNKRIHKNNIKKRIIYNIIFLILGILSSGSLSILLFSILGINTLTGFIDFQCVNLQNYNIARYSKVKDQIKRKRQRQLENYQKKYGKAIKYVSSELEKSESLPDLKTNLRSLQIDELIELRNMLLEVNKQNTESVNKSK